MPAIVGAVYDPPAMCEIVGTAKAFLAQRQLFSRSDSFSRAATAFLVQRQLFSRSDSFSRAATAFLVQRQLFSPSDSFSRPATDFLVTRSDCTLSHGHYIVRIEVPCSGGL